MTNVGNPYVVAMFSLVYTSTSPDTPEMSHSRRQ